LPHPTSRRSILILSYHLSLGLPSGLLPSGFPTKSQYAPLLSPIRATYPVHNSLLNLITRMIFGRSTDHKAPCYVVFSIPLSPHSSAPYSRKLSAYIPPANRDTCSCVLLFIVAVMNCRISSARPSFCAGGNVCPFGILFLRMQKLFLYTE
jgi:hypothetical protein